MTNKNKFCCHSMTNCQLQKPGISNLTAATQFSPTSHIRLSHNSLNPFLGYLSHRLKRIDLHARHTGQGGSKAEAKAGNACFKISLPATN